MEKKVAQNYTKIMDEILEPEQNDGGKVTIHTMPKRYTSSLPASSHAKSTGILILVLGFLFLIVALMLLYFYVLKKEPVVVSSVDPSLVEKPDTDQNTDVADPIDSPAIIDDDSDLQASSTSASTSKPIHRINASGSQDGKYSDPNDSDNDGLSDVEELLLGSSPNSEDTDGDTYLDKDEVLGLYDPASKGSLIESIFIEKFINESYGFSIFVSSVWIVEPVSGDDSLIVSLGKDQYIQIISQAISVEKSLDDWYIDLFEVDEILDEQIFKKGNWNGIINESKLTVYLKHPSKPYIITLNYEIGNDITLYYKNIFDMMLQSIAITE